MSLAEVIDGLRGADGPHGALLALHQLQELALRSQGGHDHGGTTALSAVVPHLAALLTSPDALDEPEVPALAVRALALIVDVEPGALRAVARGPVLASLAHTLDRLPSLETGGAVCALLSHVSASHAPAVLRAGLLAAALAVVDYLPLRARRAVYVLVAHCAESVSGREDAALLLDATARLVATLDAQVAQASAALSRAAAGGGGSSSSSGGGGGGGGASERDAALDARVAWDCAQLAARALGRFLSHACAQASGCLAQARAAAAAPAAPPPPALAPLPVPVWPIQTVQHLLAQGVLASFARLLALHARASALTGLPIALAPTAVPASGGGSGGGGGSWEAAAAAACGVSCAPLLRHSAFRAVTRALCRALLLVPAQRRLLVAGGPEGGSGGGGGGGLLQTARGLLAAHATAAGAPPEHSGGGGGGDGDGGDREMQSLAFAAGPSAAHLAQRLEDVLLLLQILQPPAAPPAAEAGAPLGDMGA